MWNNNLLILSLMKSFNVRAAGSVQSLTSFRTSADEVPQLEVPSTAGQLRINSTGCIQLGVDYSRLAEGGQFVDVAKCGDVSLGGVQYTDTFVVFKTDGRTGAKLAQPSKALGGPLIFSNMNVYKTLKGDAGQDVDGNIRTAIWDFILVPIVGIAEDGTAVSLETAEANGLIEDGIWLQDYEPTGNTEGDEAGIGYLLTFNEIEVKPGRPLTAGRTAPKNKKAASAAAAVSGTAVFE